MILDSMFVRDVIHENDAAVNRLTELSEAGTPVALSALTVFEVGAGLRGKNAQYRKRLDERIEDCYGGLT